MVRLSYVPLVAAVLVATGCANAGDADYAGYCVNEYSNVRVDDNQCGDFLEHGHSTNPGSYVMWINTGPGYTGNYHIPGVGQPAGIGSRSTISVRSKATVVPKAGGVIQRGGFGVSSSVGAKSSAS